MNDKRNILTEEVIILAIREVLNHMDKKSGAEVRFSVDECLGLEINIKNPII